jgi:SWI/SNF-related matrix-associated actin-dependent regulator 1 of chromatin subfamily A
MPRKTLKQHQIEAVDFAVKNNGKIINGDVVGMGKTVSTVAYLDKLNKWPVLIVAPSSVKGAWKNEFEEYIGEEAIVAEGESPYEGELKHKCVVINYDILAAQMPWLTEQNFECLVFDECQMLANLTTKWTKAARILAKRCPRVMGLSGTPIANRPADFWPILNMVRPDLFPAFKEYAWKHCAPRLNFGRWEYKGADRMDELHATLKPFMIRRNKSVLNLPPQSLRIEFVDMVGREAYDLLHAQYTSASRRSRFVKGKNAGADQLTLLQNLLMLVARCKARSTVEWIRNYLDTNPNEKLIAFCTHTQMLDVIHRRGAPEGLSMFINGSVASKRRTELIQRFQTDPSCRLAVCNIKAAGAGITLTAATKAVVCELPWTAKDITQIMGRNHRIGQTRETEMIFLLTKDTIEEKLCKVIQEKQAIHEAIIEGKKLNDLPIYKMLEMEMGK